MSLVSWLNRRVAPLITAIGITPRSVRLEVRGRTSGKRIRLSVSPSELNGKNYLVSLAGVREWVKNPRAAHVEAFIIHGIRRRVQLREVPVDQRAPILLAYVQRRAFTRSPKRAARLHFGLEAPTLEDMQRLAARSPVFAIEARRLESIGRMGA
jgi:hypothetical protein